MSTERVIELLEGEYGIRQWQTEGDPVDVLVRTVLSQNTSDVNSYRAFDRLRAGFENWEAVASAPVDLIARAIRSGGLFRIKALRIQQILQQIDQDQGRISLDFLKSKTAAEAEDYLMHLPGVGHKTARCVLLFSLGKPTLPVDTHILRVARRLGLIVPGTSIDKAHRLLQEQIAPPQVYQFHVHMIEHGRRVCRARRPACERCPLAVVCPGKRC